MRLRDVMVCVVVSIVWLFGCGEVRAQLLEDPASTKLSNAVEETRTRLINAVGAIKDIVTEDSIDVLIRSASQALLLVQKDPGNMPVALALLESIDKVAIKLIDEHEVLGRLDLVSKRDKLVELTGELKTILLRHEEEMRQKGRDAKLSVHKTLYTEQADYTHQLVTGYSGMIDELTEIPVGDSKDLIEGNVSFLKDLRVGLGLLKNYVQVAKDHGDILVRVKHYHDSVLRLHKILEEYAMTIFEHGIIPTPTDR